MSRFFILQNTQSGKLAASAAEISKWFPKKVIPFFITSNDRTLGDQTSAGLLNYCGKDRIKVMTLSSNSRISIDDIKSSIHLFLAGKGLMPVIVALANAQQNERVIELMVYIKKVSTKYPSYNLRYGIIFDEADSTYPLLRNQISNGISYFDLFINDTSFLHRLGFVTATEGELMSHDYPECASATLQKVVHAESLVANYRAIHTKDAIININPQTASNNEYAIEIIKNNLSHFTRPIRNGLFRKVIVNSNSSTEEMEVLAKQFLQYSMNVMIVNMNGLIVVTPSQNFSIAVKNRPFNKVLFLTYKKLNLDKAPLVIIGRRKVDRGLSFHYAPRDGTEGLIWTDLILGEIKDETIAVQKAGRLAGIIAHCPNYTNECVYWTTQETSELIVNKNRMNDIANQFDGSIKDALCFASKQSSTYLSQNEQATIPLLFKLTKKQVNLFQICKEDIYNFLLTKNQSMFGYKPLPTVFREGSELKQLETAYKNKTKYPLSIQTTKRKENYSQIFIDTTNAVLYFVKWNGKESAVEEKTDLSLFYPKCPKCDNNCEFNKPFCKKHNEAENKNDAPLLKNSIRVIFDDDEELIPIIEEEEELLPLIEEEEELLPLIEEEEELLPLM